MKNNYTNFLVKGTLLKSLKILNQEDTSYKELETNLFSIETNTSEEIIFSDEHGPLVERISIKFNDVEMIKNLISKSQERINGLGDKYYEIWHKNNNVNDIDKGGIHLPDPFGEPTMLIEEVKKALKEKGYEVIDPKFDYNKVSSRKRDNFSLNGTHFDSFEGMRLDEHGNRMKISRYLINMKEKDRTTTFCPYGRDLIEVLPKTYSTTLLNPVFEKLNKELSHYLITTPPADFSKGEFYGIKIMVTHVLHAEYGEKDDLLVAINTLA